MNQENQLNKLELFRKEQFTISNRSLQLRIFNS